MSCRSDAPQQQLRVIGVGFGRTGTMSLKIALEHLLGKPCYHNKENFDRNHLSLWDRGVTTKSRGRPDLSQILGGEFAAGVDFPFCLYWRELLLLSPDAKVVLTTHPKGMDAWWRSAQIIRTGSDPPFPGSVAMAAIPALRRFRSWIKRLVWDSELVFKGRFDRPTAIGAFESHISAVRAAVPRGQLLEYDVSQGWEPLCDFLGVPVPDMPFPRVNEAREIQQQIDIAHAVGKFLLAAGACAVVGAATATKWTLDALWEEGRGPWHASLVSVVSAGAAALGAVATLTFVAVSLVAILLALKAVGLDKRFVLWLLPGAANAPGLRQIDPDGVD